jgi:hypothetical protein
VDGNTEPTGAATDASAAAADASAASADASAAYADASERAPASEWPRAASVAGERDETVIDEAEQAIDDVRRRLAEVPAEVVVTNHVMGLYELAAIHLSATPPNLSAASLAIDAVGSLVDGLGERLGQDTPTLRDALANIRMAFVSVKSAAEAPPGEAADGGSDHTAATHDDTLGAQ